MSGDKIEVYESDDSSSDQQYPSIDELEADYANNNNDDDDISDQRLVTAYNSEQEFDPDYNWDFDSDLATEPDRDTSNQYDSEQQLDPGYNWDFDSDLATEPDRDISNQYEQESSQFEQTNSHFERENSHFEQENSHFERESSQLSEESSLYDFVPASPDLDMEPLWPSSDAGPDVPSNEMELNAHHHKLDVETDKSLNDFIQATANMDWITNGDWGSPEPESVDNSQGHELARGAILSHLKSRYAGEESAGSNMKWSSLKDGAQWALIYTACQDFNCTFSVAVLRLELTSEETQTFLSTYLDFWEKNKSWCNRMDHASPARITKWLIGKDLTVDDHLYFNRPTLPTDILGDQERATAEAYARHVRRVELISTIRNWIGGLGSFINLPIEPVIIEGARAMRRKVRGHSCLFDYQLICDTNPGDRWKLFPDEPKLAIWQAGGNISELLHFQPHPSGTASFQIPQPNNSFARPPQKLVSAQEASSANVQEPQALGKGGKPPASQLGEITSSHIPSHKEPAQGVSFNNAIILSDSDSDYEDDGISSSDSGDEDLPEGELENLREPENDDLLADRPGEGDPFSSQFGEYVQPCSNQNEGQLDQQQLQIDMSSLVQALQASEPPAPATAEDQGQASNHANIADQQEFISNLEDGWESQYFNDAMYGILDETDISEASSLCWPLPSSSAVATFSGTVAHGLITAQGKQSSEQIHNQETQSPDASLMPFHEDEISLSSLFQQPSLPLHASQHPALNKTTETVHKQRDQSPNASLVPGGESDIDVNSLVQQPSPPRHTLQRPAQNKPIKTVHKQHEYSRDASLAPSNESGTGGNFLIQQPRPPRPTLQLPAQIETAETAQKQHEPAQVAQEQIESSKSKKRKADSIVISEGEDEPAQVVQEQIKSNKSKKKKADSIVISGGEDEPAQVAQKQSKSNKSKKNKAESIAISEGEDELSTMDLTPVPKKSRRKRSAEDSDEDYKPPAKRPRRSKGSTAARKTPQQKAAPQKPTPQQQVDPSQPQQPVKRGRGRPRKYPLPTNQASTAGTTQKQEVPPVPDKNIAVPSVTEGQSSAAQVTSTPAPSLKSASDQVATVSAKKQGRTPKTAKHATTEGTTGSNVDDFAPGQTVSVPAIANALSSMSQSRNEAIITPDRASKPTAPAVYKSLPSVSASRSTALPVKDHSISEKAQTLVLPARSTPARSSSQDIDMAEADKDMREYIERASSSPRQAVRAAGQSASSTAANGRLGGPGGTSIGRQPRIGGTPGWDPYSLAPTPLPISNIHSDAAAVAYRAHLPKNHWKMSQQEMIAYEEARPGYESFFKQHSNGQHQLREAAARGAQAQRIINGGDTSQSYGGNAGHSASDNAPSDTGYGTPSTSAFQQSARGQGQRLLAPRPAPEAAAKASDVSQSWAGMASALASGPGADQNSGLIESIEKETGVQRKKAQKPKKAAAKPKKTNH
ncbi:hypothetical protein C8034_v001185 [Colletotrichum sidae]|uniref:Uncharacterized protein n=1 Tax=Colletotrichum sidae TaxID=1347389 RepID=A0A4R8TUU6_9PEZI|nr:hypothetical protein C8034_v001185 [Colletotrichum sidae]